MKWPVADFTYTVRQSGAVAVFSGPGCAGHIKSAPGGGYYYQPKGTRQRGDTLATIDLVKASIEKEGT